MYQPPSHNYQNSRPPGHHPVPTPLSIQPPQNSPYTPYNASISLPPQSPSQGSEPNDEGNFNLLGPAPVSRVWEGKGWALEVVQQPIRARMCGFGDKDRRPISPPPCIRLLIFDPESGKEVDYNKVADLSRLVLNVDLWNLQGSREDNCVKHNTASPSISSVTTTSFPPTVTGPTSGTGPVATFPIPNVPAFASQTFASPTTSAASPASSYYPSEDQRTYSNGAQSYGQRNPSYSYSESRYSSQYQNGYEPSYNSRSSTVGSASSSGNALRSARSSQDLGPPKDAHIAKNLIGSASSSAFKLTDDKGRVGLWFVLQDLSVRTEGWFRLKMNFFNLSEFVMNEEGDKGNPPNLELLQEAPCLASAFSKPFKVYSAKKFPGVIETTDLSRQFARQGIKIPIRKDGNSKRRKGPNADDEDAADDDDDDDY
ncbi:uncharacterized protein Z518_10319 [Rhinocladiella mackenziei CBS 650.93]|uniref:Velvet domain-containing protein n=1 Tax=Rhinocladiella mackenziei CBS 650.93 TaxID=1442369 RepID=A0A0D2IAA8_9EURO|nr:uncharacterized protein Z518_10319 [Rhinocladiella mackenziei CBS 650.93]KIX00181.1 hypothetical protein Z518_10319 [Rhinocladiella mackenziei CBS 650.93]